MSGARHYAVVTAAYWGFTLTDGALRMLVLLHFYRLGYSPFTLALLFLLYEAAGVGANLVGGWLATRYGITRMLASGLALQVAGFLLLSAMSPAWAPALSVAWVVVAQGVCGVAKDLTKTASKSAIKLTATGEPGQLFRWVAWFTGSKNAMKGVGFFLGGLLLELVGFKGALWIMAAALGLILVAVVAALPPMLGRAKASRSAREFFAKSRGVNLLAAARVVLFASRDIWFVVGVPVFLYSTGWSFTAVGAFLALWTIGYGVGSGGGARCCATKSRRTVHRGQGCALVVAWPGCVAGRLGHRAEPGHCAPRCGAGGRTLRLWCCICREFLGAFVLDPCLCGLGKGCRGRRVLLCGKRRWSISRRRLVRRALPVGWHRGSALRLCAAPRPLLVRHARPSVPRARLRIHVNRPPSYTRP